MESQQCHLSFLLAGGDPQLVNKRMLRHQNLLQDFEKWFLREQKVIACNFLTNHCDEEIKSSRNPLEAVHAGKCLLEDLVYAILFLRRL